MDDKMIIAVDKDVIDALLEISRIGERQSVEFSYDNNEMAVRAAVLSKDMCARSIEILLEILTGKDVDMRSVSGVPRQS